VRRGICRPCGKTFTILPDWLARSGGAFQLALSTTGLREHRRRCGRGAISTALQRPVALARPINSAPMGGTSPTQRVVLADRQGSRRVLFADTHHRCLGSQRALPYSANRGKKSVTRMALDELKQQIPLLEYLQAHDWQHARPIGFGRFLGLCPLHADREPSFLVDPTKTCSTAMAAVAVATSFASSNSTTR